MTHRKHLVTCLAAIATLFAAGIAHAGDTLERARSGETIRIGFSNEAPYAFQNDAGEMDGFVNEVGLAILERMGVENVEPVLTDWGSLIPGLKAGRFDIITAGMYILPKRCAQVAFTDPMAELGEQFMVKKGNPLDLHSFKDLAENEDATLVTVAGYSTVGWARKAGIPDSRIMQVQDPAAMLQAVKSGRADAASATLFAMTDLVKKGGDDVQLAKPFTSPDYTKGWSAYAFRKGDQDFVEAWNEAQAEFMKTDEFWDIVEPYGYTKEQVPGDDVSTESLCEG